MPLGTGELLFIVVLVLLLFGPDKLPELARGLGKGMREIRKITSEFQSQLNVLADLEDEKPKPPPRTRRPVERPRTPTSATAPGETPWEPSSSATQTDPEAAALSDEAPESSASAKRKAQRPAVSLLIDVNARTLSNPSCYLHQRMTKEGCHPERSEGSSLQRLVGGICERPHYLLPGHGRKTGKL